MARRTSRRPKVVWLPTDINNRLGIAPAAATVGSESNVGVDQLIIPGGGAGASVVDVLPLVKDEPQNITGLTETLSDLEGSAYRLRRIVGKIFCSYEQGTTQIDVTAATSIMLKAGIIVLRVDRGGVPLSIFTEYDVLSLDSVRDPWIWQRSWTLTNQPGAIANGPGDSFFLNGLPNNFAGSVMDGPHVDAKTARVVSDEERLFLVLTATNLDGDPQDQVTTRANVFWDLRVLASMRSQSGNRRNASR